MGTKLAFILVFCFFFHKKPPTWCKLNTTLTVPSVFSGIKHLKSQSDSVFPEEEEGVGEREEEWGH